MISIDKILKKFNITDCKGKVAITEVNFQVDLKNEDEAANVPYRKFVGCLNYLGMITRPDICFATFSLGRFLDKS